jgi:hypothetical protein
MERLRTFARNNPVRVQAFVTSALLLAASVWDVPAEALATFVLAALGLGEFTQRVENLKTAQAYRDTFIETDE